MNIKKPLLWIGIPIAVILAVIIIISKQGPAKRSFQFVKIEKGNIESTVSCTGTLQFYKTENVVPQVAGIINRLYVDFNQKIRQGQVLATIDSSSYKLDAQTAQANLDKAKAQVEQSLKDYKDTKDLFDQNFKSQNDLDTARLNLITASNALQTSQVALESAKLNLRYTTITSPLSGIVVQRNVSVGDAVAANQTSSPAFIVASDISKMQSLASVDESDIGSIKVGQKVRFTVQAFSDKKFDGVVSQIRLQPQTVNNVVNYTVVVDVYNKSGLLLPGMTATMDLITSQLSDVYKIPNTALKFRPPSDMMKEIARSFTNARGMGFSGHNTNRQAFGSGNGGNTPGQNGWQGQNGNSGGKQDSGLLWTVDEKSGRIHPVRVKIGMTDGQMTQIISTNITEDMQFISGIVTGKSASTSSQAAKNPFQPTRGGGGGGHGGPPPM